MAKRNARKLVAAIAGDEDASMVSKPYGNKTDSVGDDPEDDRVLNLNPKNPLQTNRINYEKGNPNQERHTYRDNALILE